MERSDERSVHSVKCDEEGRIGWIKIGRDS